MTNGNNGEELDNLRNKKNEDLDAQAKTVGGENPTFIAYKPSGANTKPAPVPTNNGISTPKGGAPIYAPSGTGKGSPAGQGPSLAPDEYPDVVVWYQLLHNAPKIREFMNAVGEKLREKLEPPAPTARSSEGGLGNQLLRSVNGSIGSQQSTAPSASTPKTPMGPQPYNPAKNTGDTYNGPVLRDPSRDLVQPGNGQKSKPAGTRRQEPGSSPPHQRGGSKKTVEPAKKAEPFRNDRFHQRNTAEETQRLREASPNEFGWAGREIDPSNFGRTMTLSR
jgi:hypothetical protein